MNRVALSMLAAVALMSVVLVSGASAHRVKFDTAVTAKYTKPDKKDPYATASFDGAVNAAKVRCEQSRRVILNMRMADGTSVAVGTDVTDAAGEWQVSSTVAAGTYFAQVPRKVLRKSSKHRHVCKKAVSRDVNVK